MNIIETIMSGKDAKQTFVALAHRVKLNETNWKKKYLISLLESAFFYKDDHFFESFADIQEFIKCEGITCFEIYEYELKEAFNELAGKECLLKTFNGWKLAEKRKGELEKITNEWLNLEEKVKEDWLNNIGTKYLNLQKDEKTLLWTNLIEKFVVRIFLRHGAETSKLIFGYQIPDADRFLESLHGILENIIVELPHSLKDIVKNEYPLFFDPTDFNRRQYLMGLLDSSLSHFAMAIPEDCLKSIYGMVSIELKLLLDTNFLFSAMGLGENHLSESVKDVIKLQQAIPTISDGKIRIKFYYTRETLGEFRKAIDSSISRLNGTRVNQSVARAVIKSERLSGVDLGYFRKLAESSVSISPKEYYKPYSKGAERLLHKEGIEVHSSKDGVSLDEIRYAQEVIDDTHDFDTFLKEKEREREWETIEHDVRLWHYVKKLRESLSTSSLTTMPLSSTCFILTLDYRFRSFDRHKFKGNNEHPICLLPTQFLQMLSLFIPRTEDFEKAFISLIKTPLARTVDLETERTSLNILKALAMYKDFSEDIAIEILLDEALQTETKNIKDPETIRKLIEEKLSAELESQRRRYQEEKRLQREKITEKDEQILRMEDRLIQYEKRIKELEEFKQEVDNKSQTEEKKNILHKLKSLSKFIAKGFSFFAWLANFIKNLWELKSKLGL